MPPIDTAEREAKTRAHALKSLRTRAQVVGCRVDETGTEFWGFWGQRRHPIADTRVHVEGRHGHGDVFLIFEGALFQDAVKIPSHRSRYVHQFAAEFNTHAMNLR